MARALESVDTEVLGIDVDPSEQLTRLEKIGPLAREESTNPRYNPDNIMFMPADAAVYRAMLRDAQPNLVIEVGVGYSSAAALDAVDADGLGTRFEFIDPDPVRLDAMTRPQDADRIKVHRSLVQDVDLAVFDALGEGDILFIDSTHVSKAGSDVNHLLFRVLPRLRPGVLIHVHDVFWPFEYPRDWFDQGVSWNEAYLLRAFLSFNSAFRVELFTSLVQQREPEAFASLTGAPLESRASSVWLRKVA